MPGDENTARKIERAENRENLVRGPNHGPNDFGGWG